jgi:hypothetical protein
VVWVFRQGDRELHAVLPVDQEEEFLERLDAGHYDDIVRRELRRRVRQRRLVLHAELQEAAWWHEVRPGALVPAERTPTGQPPRVSYRHAARQLRAASLR